MQKIYRFGLLFIILSTFVLRAAEREIGPYLQSAKPTEIMVLWETTAPAVGKVVYGLAPDQLIEEKVEDAPSKFHKIQLSGLNPGTSYYYQCQWANKTTPVYRFKTAPQDEWQSIRIAVLGDSRSQPHIFSRICQQIISHDPDIVLHSGDIVADGRQVEQWKPQFFEPAKELLHRVPIYPTPGNHEQKADYYFEHFPVHGDDLWWSVDYGSVHIIGLNSLEDGSSGSPQYDWLVKDLESNQHQKWRIAMFHHPLFHAHPRRPVYDIRYHWTPLFNQKNVPLIVAGHDHYYLRTHPIGSFTEKNQRSVHIISAGGGAPLYDFVEKSYTAKAQSVYHFMILDVSPEKIICRAIDIDGVIFDTVELRADGLTPDQGYIEYEMFELQRRATFAVANLAEHQSKTTPRNFDTNLVISTQFQVPLTGNYYWQAPENWMVAPAEKSPVVVNPGEPLIVSFQANVFSPQMTPAPILKIHLEAAPASAETTSDAEIRVRDHFINNKIEISFEQSLFSKLLSSNDWQMDEIAFFLDFFGSGEYSAAALNHLNRSISKKIDEQGLQFLDEFLAKFPGPENKYRLYPFYFLEKDYQHWEEWEDLAEKFAPYHIDLPDRMMYRISRHEAINAEFIQDWWILGPFPWNMTVA
ncbi:MAG: metallophosphoesterase family protein, partial [bacterium]|nr:metallophosphoesterase family protein [bacterium]